MSCLVGVIELDSGQIELFNAEPKNIKSCIAYMPQETALMEQFSISEVIWFYGTIYGLSSKKISEKVKFLSELLELSDMNKLVKDCSGGQQRRISLAATLVHEPKLLVLDEPTVGLDPILRAKIWDYLVEITERRNATVLFTTHYIEEARQSTHIGLMRDGELLAQDSPQNVLRAIGTTCLEKAFLIMSQNQESKHLPGLTSTNKPNRVKLLIVANNRCQVTELDEQKVDIARIDSDEWAEKIQLNPSTRKVLWALLKKNFIEVRRNG